MSRPPTIPSQLLHLSTLLSSTQSEDAPASNEPRPEPRKLDPEIIDMILGKPVAVQMKELMSTIEDVSVGYDDRINALDELEMHIEQIDNAVDLQPLGLWPRLLRVLDAGAEIHAKASSDEAYEVRKYAAWICGTAVQNNPVAQEYLLKHDGLAKMVAIIDEYRIVPDASDMCLKALYCVSAMLRHFSPGLTAFSEKLDGWNVLTRYVQAVTENGSSGAAAGKIAFLVQTLLRQEMQSDQQLVVKGITHDSELLGSLITVASQAVPSARSEPMHADLIEKTLMLLAVLPEDVTLPANIKDSAKTFVSAIPNDLRKDEIVQLETAEWSRIQKLIK
ncbi:Fes1-domain-containing protein [Ramicandelaber brevisporus]|nr:Fes1-domain-containing protein [Ramicandelaber brevisporus]